MGLITKEITYDYQLNQSISEMIVTCRLNKHQQRTFTHKISENRKSLTTQLKEACNFSYNKNRSFDYNSSIVEPKIEPLVRLKNRYL